MHDINELISTLLPGIKALDALLLFMLIFTRILMLSIVMPILGSHLLAAPIRIGLATILSIVAFVFLLPDFREPNNLDIFVIFLLFIKEALLGFAIGLLGSLIFYIYELAGELIDIARAASMSRILVPELKHQSSALGVLLFQWALVIFISLGFHRDLLGAIFLSFNKFYPLDLMPSFFNASLLQGTYGFLSLCFNIAIKLALPIIAISLFIDLAFGLLNRVAPQINAYFLSLPAKMMGGLIILFLTLAFLLEDFATMSHQSLRFFHLLLS